jgi:hypothetical protein
MCGTVSPLIHLIGIDDPSESSKPNRKSKVARITLVVGTEKYTIPDDLESNEDLAKSTSG